MESTEQLNLTFAALADPTRRAILDRLMHGPASVGELAEPFAVSLPAISRHLRVLAKAGLISRSKDAQWRRCSLSADPLRGAATWLDQYRPFWEHSFDGLDKHLQKQQRVRKSGAASRKKTEND